MGIRRGACTTNSRPKKILTMNKLHPLIPAGPGSKQSHLRELKPWQAVLNAHPYKTIYEPFACGLTTSLALLQQENSTLERIICAEIDPSLRDLYLAWMNSQPRSYITQSIKNWQAYPIDNVIEYFKKTYEESWIEKSSNLNVAVAGILLRYIAYNGKLAPNANSTKLNIKPSDQQCENWGSINYQFPDCRPSEIEVYDDVYEIRWSETKNPTIAIVDPPYAGNIANVKYRDPDFIRPVYFKHKPHSKFTYDYAVNVIDEVLSINTTVVIACNYYSDRLNNEYIEAAKHYGYNVFNYDGIQPKLNNGKRSKKELYYKDSYWIFCFPDDPLAAILMSTN